MTNLDDKEQSALSDEEQLDQLRSIILGEDNQVISDTFREQARHQVSAIITEAIHDRQLKDQSLDKVLQPIIESSVDASVTDRSDKMVNVLYPLVGSLVRKSVSSFLSDFIEKTNQMLENSLSIKGLRWRFEAWQRDVSFAQYIASQTFVYRVEHLLLIHRETGILLHSVDRDAQTRGDSDLISSMLSAINDFVGDSFSPDEDGLKENLNTVSTDNFKLLIQPGPKAILVAAITGQPPQALSEKMQLIIEEIHKLYSTELDSFNGDTSVFEHSESILCGGLIEEQKEELGHSKKKWKVWLLVTAIACAICYFFVLRWQEYSLIQRLRGLDDQAGILVREIKAKDKIYLSLSRDPNAIPVSVWLTEQGIDEDGLSISEKKYISLDFEITRKRVESLLSRYSGVRFYWEEKTLYLDGAISSGRESDLMNEIYVAGLNVDTQVNTRALKVEGPDQLQVSPALAQEYQFKDSIKKVNSTQINFAKKSDTLTSEVLEEVKSLALEFLNIQKLGESLNVSVGLVIIGASDTSGTSVSNERLSTKRALNTKYALETYGVDESSMYASGLGQLSIPAIEESSRMVMFSVIYFEAINKNAQEGSL